MKNEMKNEVPDFVEKSFCNLEDILRHLTDEGLESLQFDATQMDKVQVTQFGIKCEMENRYGDGFSVLVMDDDDTDKFRLRILECAEGIRRNFPHLVNPSLRLVK